MIDTFGIKLRWHMFKAGIKHKVDIVKFKALVRSLGEKGCLIEDVDYDSFQAIISCQDSKPFILYLSPDSDVAEIDVSFIISSDIMNLKTLSILNYMAMYNSTLISGIENEIGERVRMTIRKEIPYSALKKNPKKELLSFHRASVMIDEHLDLRIEETDCEMVDISMFKHLDINTFCPRMHGEKKEFKYGSWEKYLASLARDVSVLGMRRLDEAKACQEFEEKNDLRLASIGDELPEIISWSNEITQANKDTDFYMN